MTDIDNSLKVGTILHGPTRNYTIVETLGKGGFGITYKVESIVSIGNIKAKIYFAIKEHFISSLCVRDGDSQSINYSVSVTKDVNNYRQAFIKEAKRLQELGIDHHNIIRINEVFEANNTAYYVMEFLNGETINDYVKQYGPLSEEQTKEFMMPIIDAIALLHKNHIVHYDIKPSNIILTKDDETGGCRPTIIDFGLAKHYDDSGEATSVLAMKGYTPGYAPGEQYAGVNSFSPRCDVYSIAATLYFCFTGQTPPNSFSITPEELDNHLSEYTNEHIRKVIIKAMSIRPADRYSDASELYDAIINEEEAIPISNNTQSLNGSDKPETPPSPKKDFKQEDKTPTNNARKKRRIILLFCLAAITLMGIVLYFTFLDNSQKSVSKNEHAEVASNKSDTSESNPNTTNISEEKQSHATVSKQKTETPVTINKATAIEQQKKQGHSKSTAEEPSITKEQKSKTPEPTKNSTTPITTTTSSTTSTPTTNNNPNTSTKSKVPIGNNQNIPATSTTNNTLTEPPVIPPTPKYRTSAQNLDLAVTKNGQKYYFSISEWDKLGHSERSTFTKRGVVVIGNGQRFIVNLHIESAKGAWNFSKSRYTLPSKEQAQAMADNLAQLNQAITHFGGDPSTGTPFWTKTEFDANRAYCLNMNNGKVVDMSKSFTYNSRQILAL